MASRSQKFCAHHGCSTLISTGAYCEAHAHDGMASRYGDRGSSAERGYDAQWRTVREAYMRRHPLCERCEAKGVTEVATMVHHKVALRDGGERLNENNLMSLCFDCHAIVEGRKIEVKRFDE